MKQRGILADWWGVGVRRGDSVRGEFVCDGVDEL